MHQHFNETDDAILDILVRHAIPKTHHAEFTYLVDAGEITCPEFRRRLKSDVSYQAACTEIMELLSRPFYHLSIASPPRFESLSVSDCTPLESLYEQS